jgi:hypothetical protein
MKTIFKIITVMVLVSVSMSACDYLDVVPDNIATIDNAFSNRNQAEKYLYSCYSYRPVIGDLDNDPAMFGGDEVWQYYPTAVAVNHIYHGTQIARGLQNLNNPWVNYWSGGGNGGKPLWRGIRDCNIFLENIDKVMDIPPYEKTRWIAEVKFLKAYYHYYLLKCYGPIPIVDVNLPISAGVDEVKVYREPVDKVVEYVSNLVLEVLPDLPDANQVLEGTEAGRIDKLAALGMRAEMLLFVASPLFNGNTDYKSMVDNRGEQLFNQTYDANKWKIAADALKELIDLCHAQGKKLYKQVSSRTAAAPHELQLQTTYRQAICDRWNEELIWGGTNNNCALLSKTAHARIVRMAVGNIASVTSEYCPTLKTVEAYYSSNGVPVEEDTQWAQNGWYSDRYKVREEPSSGTPEIYYVKEGQKTVNLHYNREPRFYASIGFDRGIYYGSGYYDLSNVKHLESFNLEYSGIILGSQFSWTGYAAKKMHSFEVTVETNNVNLMPGGYYPFPILRLADIYLMYAEALNEAEDSPTARAQAIEYIDLVRERVELEGVTDSWTKYSSLPNKPATQDGLREIIHRERTIELALEGKRFWDLRRWKKISELNDQPRGWNINGETREDYYNVLEVARVPANFTVRDYFWPIKESDIITNRNLIQNYGW